MDVVDLDQRLPVDALAGAQGLRRLLQDPQRPDVSAAISRSGRSASTTWTSVMAARVRCAIRTARCSARSDRGEKWVATRMRSISDFLSSGTGRRRYTR
jgi:hypothetical protein